MAFPGHGAGGAYVKARRAARLIAGAVTLLLLAAGVALAGSTEGKSPRSQESRDQLKEVQRELGRERQKVKDARRKEESLSRELSALEDDLKNKTRLLKDLETKLRGSAQRIAKLSREIDGTDTRLQRSRTLLRQRLRAMYKQGRMGYVGVLLSADDFSGAGRRLKYLSALAAQDQRLIKAYNTSLTDLSEKRAEFARYKKEVSEASGKAAATRNQIMEEQRRYRVLLAKIREDKAGHLAAVKELEKSAKDLQTLIAKLQSDEERQRRASRAAPKREGARGQGAGKEPEESLELPDDGRFERLRGRLPWPASGTLASTFGRQEHPRFRTVTFNRGIEITAPQGRDIVAVAEGTAIYADWFKGYGRLVILDHGSGYFTLYAHASDILIKTGDTVSGGQVIAKVGDSGSLEGPQLYFELRHKGKPQDPLTWLRSR
jgi:septal ring factor EnvC (AmiA/AmiB activator)